MTELGASSIARLASAMALLVVLVLHGHESANSMSQVFGII